MHSLHKKQVKNFCSPGYRATGGLWYCGDYSYQCCWFSNKVELLCADFFIYWYLFNIQLNCTFCFAGLLSKLFCIDMDFLQNIPSVEPFVWVSIMNLISIELL